MDNSRTAAMRAQALPAGVLLLFGGAFTLLQLTSLALGPSPSRQFNLSLAVPAVALEDGPNSLGSQVDIVVGAVIAAAAPAERQSVDRAVPARPAVAAAARPLRDPIVVKPVVAVGHPAPVVTKPITPVSTPASIIALPPVPASAGDQAAKGRHSGSEEHGEGQRSDSARDRD